MIPRKYKSIQPAFQNKQEEEATQVVNKQTLVQTSGNTMDVNEVCHESDSESCLDDGAKPPRSQEYQP